MEEENNYQTNETKIEEQATEAVEAETPVPHYESQLKMKKPNIIWTLATLVFLAATLMELYVLSTAPPLKPPGAIMANLSVQQALTVNTIQLNQEYKSALGNRGEYEVGAALIALVLGGMFAKNMYLTLRT